MTSKAILPRRSQISIGTFVDTSRARVSSFAENIRTGVLLRRLPEGNLKHHLILNAQCLLTLESMKFEVEDVRRAQLPISCTSVPMDVDAIDTAK